MSTELDKSIVKLAIAEIVRRFGLGTTLAQLIESDPGSKSYLHTFLALLLGTAFGLTLMHSQGAFLDKTLSTELAFVFTWLHVCCCLTDQFD
jgi:hypothetical protein